VSAKCWFWTNFSFRPTNKQTTLSNSRGLFFGSFERLFFFLTFFAILCYCTITRQLVVKKKLSNKARNNQRQFSKPFRIGQSCSALLVCQNQLDVNKQFLIRAQCSIFAHTHCEMAGRWPTKINGKKMQPAKNGLHFLFFFGGLFLTVSKLFLQIMEENYICTRECVDLDRTINQVCMNLIFAFVKCGQFDGMGIRWQWCHSSTVLEHSRDCTLCYFGLWRPFMLQVLQ
jgi:hypothetical protein